MRSRSTSRAGSAQTMGVLAGRFQLPHLGHTDAIEQALEQVDTLAILTGSARRPRSYYNPNTAEERRVMLLAAMPERIHDRITILPLQDTLYNDTRWVQNVQTAAAEALRTFGLPESTDITLTGHKKDGTGYYLDLFPRWGAGPLADTTGLSSTPLRERYFLRGERLGPSLVAPAVADLLEDFRDTPDYDKLVREYHFVQEYRRPYAELTYPPTFNTVDACVVQAGYVLMIKRKEMPGKGLWALPGGFLEKNARLEDWAFAELVQETQIDVPEIVLRRSAKRWETYDEVHRDARGRFITRCGLIVLESPPRRDGARVTLPKVRGSDDALRAKWFPLSGPGALDPATVYADHYDIIQDLTAGL